MIEQVRQVLAQRTQAEVDESQYLVFVHVHIPVTEWIIWVVDGQVRQAVLDEHVAQEEWQATHKLLTLL